MSSSNAGSADMNSKPKSRVINLQEAGYFLRIILLLIQNKKENAQAFYLPNSSVIRSFTAYIWCLPAQLFMWSLLWRSYHEQDPNIVGSQSSFLIQISFFDALGWVASVLTIFLILTAMSLNKAVGPLIIATNWFGLFATYIFFIPSILSYLFPTSQNVFGLLEFIAYLGIVAMYFRITRQILGNQKMVAFAITLASVVVSIFLSMTVFGFLLKT